MKKFDKNYVITYQNCSKSVPIVLFAIFASNSTDFIKIVHAILPKSRRMILDYQLNSLLENCLKTQLVGFGCADVLGFCVGSNLVSLFSFASK